MLKKIILTIVALLLIGGGALFAINSKDNYDFTKFKAVATNGLQVGSKIDFTLPDQFNKAYKLTNDINKVIFVFSKDMGHISREYFKKHNKDFLPKHKALFIADVSAMPSFIRNTFAIPDFQKSPYSVLLIYDKNIAKIFKTKNNKDKIVIAFIKNKTIKDIKYATTQEELDNLIKK
jgi:hypothetical protein